MKSILLKPKPAAIVLCLKDAGQLWYPSKLARASGTSYVHTVNFLSELVRLGAASCERKGRRNLYKLTEKGACLALSLDDLAKRCEAAEADAKAAQAAMQKEKEKPKETRGEEKKE